MKEVFVSNNKEETIKLGKILGSLVSRGDVILLTGDLGAGKTTFTSGVASALGIKDSVISPTFNIMKCYMDGTLPLYHIDAYRLENQNVELGLDEFIEGDGVCLIEWPIFIERLIPDEHLDIEIRNLGQDSRSIAITGNDSHYDEIVAKMKEAF